MQDKNTAKPNEEISSQKRRIRELKPSESLEAMRAEVEHYQKRFAALNDIGRSLTSELNLDALLDSIVQRALNLLNGAVCNCYLYNSQVDLLERVAEAGAQMVPGKEARQRGAGAVGQVWVSGAPLLVNDYRSWPGRIKAYDRLPSSALMAVPIFCGTEFLGVLDVMAPLPHQYAQADLDLLSWFAAQAAIAIRNVRLVDRMKLELAERQKAEEGTRELLQMIEAVPSSIVVRDADGNPLYANQRTFDLHGYSRDEFMALNLQRIVSPASEKPMDRRDLAEKIREVLDR